MQTPCHSLVRLYRKRDLQKNDVYLFQIEQKSGARVRVVAPPPPTNNAIEEENDGVVVIQGSRENVLAAEIAVRKVIAQTPPVLTENVYVPKWSIGFIIGKNFITFQNTVIKSFYLGKKGTNIRELSYVSGARAIIGRSGNDMEVITIKGRPIAIETAKVSLVVLYTLHLGLGSFLWVSVVVFGLAA